MVNFHEKFLRLVLFWLALFSCSAASAQTADESVRPYYGAFQYGTNLGYYGPAWNDGSLADIAQKIGSHSLRPTLPESFVEQYGYGIRQAEFTKYINEQGMKELTCFIEAPSEAHRDKTVYGTNGQQSKLFARLYDPIWNYDGTVNANNYYAIYVYRLLQTYGDKVRFWEVVNEPDFTNVYNLSDWLVRPPSPSEQINMQAPIFHYIRMLRITYEVVKKYRPDAYVTMGGLGYSQYLDALLRYTDNPNGGTKTAEYPRAGGAYFDVLSFHCYPSYLLHHWDNSIGGMRYTRTSDYAASKVIEFKKELDGVLAKYGYDGSKYPVKVKVITESNIGRRTSEDRTGSDEMQRNYGIKALVLAQKNEIRQFYYYSLGENINAPWTGSMVNGEEEISLMGLYENLNRDAPGSARLTQLGRAFATTSQLLYGYQYDAARTAAMSLPASVEGGAFGKDGSYVYVLWAKALVDNSEYASASYSFPAGWGLGSVQRYEWDFSGTGTKTTPSAQNLSLSGVPSFFTSSGMVAATTPTAAPAPTPAAATCSGTGSLSREQWNNVSGSSVSSIPVWNTPSSTSTLTQFEAVTSSDNNYGARLRGYVCPPQSGAYIFSLSGDDETELWLSTDENPANRVRIATCAGWTTGPRDYARYATQVSGLMNLTAGKRYYIEALHKQGWGPGYVSVSWRLPDGSSEAPIAGSRLSPFGATTTSTASTTPTPAPTTTPTPAPIPTATACSGTGSLSREQWNNVTGNAVGNIPVWSTPSSTSTLTQFEAPTGQGWNYGARLRGYVCPPQSGAYTFNIVGDDDSELWLSTDDQPGNRVRIATCTGWTSWSHDWNRYAAQQSAPINLVAGKRYYIEALHKQGWGNDYLAVAWRLPDGTFEGPIAGSRLAPFGTSTGASAVAAKTTASALLAGSAPAASAKEAQASVEAGTELTAYPNPFGQQATVQFRLGAAGPATLGLYDVRGQLVRQLFQGPGAAGTVQRVRLSAQGLSQGIYVLRLVTGQQVLTQKLVLDK